MTCHDTYNSKELEAFDENTITGEIDVTTPRLSTPFYEALKKKYPKAFKRRSSVSSQASDTASLCSESSIGSVQTESLFMHKREKPPFSHREGLPPLPPGRLKGQRTENVNVIDSSHTVKFNQNHNSNFIRDLDLSSKVFLNGNDSEIDSSLSIAKRYRHYSSVTSLQNDLKESQWNKDIPKPSHYSSTFSLKSCVESFSGSLYKTDSTQSLKDRLKQNQNSWKKLLAADNSPFRLRNNNKVSDCNLSNNYENQPPFKLCKQGPSLDTKCEHIKRQSKTLRMLEEIQNKLSSQANIVKIKRANGILSMTDNYISKQKDARVNEISSVISQRHQDQGKSSIVRIHSPESHDSAVELDSVSIHSNPLRYEYNYELNRKQQYKRNFNSEGQEKEYQCDKSITKKHSHQMNNDENQASHSMKFVSSAYLKFGSNSDVDSGIEGRQLKNLSHSSLDNWMDENDDESSKQCKTDLPNSNQSAVTLHKLRSRQRYREDRKGNIPVRANHNIAAQKNEKDLESTHCQSELQQSTSKESESVTPKLSCKSKFRSHSAELRNNKRERVIFQDELGGSITKNIRTYGSNLETGKGFLSNLKYYHSDEDTDVVPEKSHKIEKTVYSGYENRSRSSDGMESDYLAKSHKQKVSPAVVLPKPSLGEPKKVNKKGKTNTKQQLTSRFSHSKYDTSLSDNDLNDEVAKYTQLIGTVKAGQSLNGQYNRDSCSPIREAKANSLHISAQAVTIDNTLSNMKHSENASSLNSKSDPEQINQLVPVKPPRSRKHIKYRPASCGPEIGSRKSKNEEGYEDISYFSKKRNQSPKKDNSLNPEVVYATVTKKHSSIDCGGLNTFITFEDTEDEDIYTRPPLPQRAYHNDLPSSTLNRDISGSRTSLMDSFKDSAKKKISKLRRALSLERLSKDSSLPDVDNSHLSGKIKKTTSLKSLFMGKKTSGSYHIDSNSELPNENKWNRSSSLSALSKVELPKNYRKVGKINSVNPDGTQVIELIKPPHGPFGFYMARGNIKFNYGVFVSRLGDGLPEHFFAGLLGIGDEIIEIDNVSVKELPLDDIYGMIETKDKLILKVMPFVSRKDT